MRVGPSSFSDPRRTFIVCGLIFLDSILYKTKLPFVLVFNKTDVEPHAFAIEWMQDFEAFQAALATHSGSRDADGEPTYMNSLMNSMSLVLDEFYKHLKVSIFWRSREITISNVGQGCGCLQHDRRRNTSVS